METDMNLLLIGGNGDIETVFILNWRKHNDNRHVSGSIEVYTLDANGMPVRRGPPQTIFPRPPNSQNQVITITRRQLFLGRPFANRDPNDLFEYRLDEPRVAASDALALMGLAPA
ncbi:hypothetical protein BDV28DRAFT_144603 [Aspergillus coremiiformis]|uniref:Uncharacterized protein n=1 Tax=Aspergillus coremiiformis TaxID=138285 RepID=A0A5N6ZI92_9EURO|nr:hypothetical protein BDV28DRAFT_144603 [Aspergillus coremiiformis]